jgi:intracellular sulfur oxidation DsrE/DsrF family protein
VNHHPSRRKALAGFGAAAGALLTRAPQAGATAPRAGALADLERRLAAAPRRRGFDRVPFMIDRDMLWDRQASDILLGYRGGPRQVWESSDIAAAWPNLIREAVNGQVFAHGNSDFLAVSATHGSAHLTLFDQAAWDKYGLAANTGGKLARNELLTVRGGVHPEDDRQDVNGFYGPGNNNIPSLQRRGVVFVACHDSIHAIARGLAARVGTEADVIAADLTNHLVPGAILVPSVVAYLVELQRAGFTYAKAA